MKFLFLTFLFIELTHVGEIEPRDVDKRQPTRTFPSPHVCFVVLRGVPNIPSLPRLETQGRDEDGNQIWSWVSSLPLLTPNTSTTIYKRYSILRPPSTFDLGVGVSVVTHLTLFKSTTSELQNQVRDLGSRNVLDPLDSFQPGGG